MVPDVSFHEEAVVIEDLIMKQLMATRASAEALLHSIDMFQAMVRQEKPDTGGVPTPPPPGMKDTAPGECDHPSDHRLHTPTMGNLRRQLCGVCGKEVTE
jgi:hypothetical protein